MKKGGLLIGWEIETGHACEALRLRGTPALQIRPHSRYSALVSPGRYDDGAFQIQDWS